DKWERERQESYVELGQPSDADLLLCRLQGELDQAVLALERGLPENTFAAIDDGVLRLRRRDALVLPHSVETLKRVIHTHLSPVRIERLLMEVDAWCHFTGELRPLEGRSPARPDALHRALLAALVAHGTNLGVAMMAQSTEGISVEALQQASRWYLRPETLKAANRVLVNYHHQLPISTTWGSGTASSSDGQRFGVEASTLLGSFYPRYFGYYERAVTVLTHVSDQYSVFAS